MLDALLGGLLGKGGAAAGEKQESGLDKLLPLILLFIIIVGGLKLLKAKEEPEPCEPMPLPDDQCYQNPLAY